MAVANAGVKLVGGSARVFPTDFREGILDLVGTIWNPITECIEEVTLKQVLGGEGMYTKRSIFFIGAGGFGKTTLIASLAQELSHRH